jgi:hypothetical protein
MQQTELERILIECQNVLPQEYERLSSRHANRVVLFEMLNRFPNEVGPIVMEFFLQSREYRSAMRLIQDFRNN